jgi:CheY-like chemotaxis protein
MTIHTPSLLITDDDPAFRETLQIVLEPEGYRTFLAGDGEEALSIIRREEVHLLLMDVHMPRLTGLETLRLIRQIGLLLPCILLSAELDERTIQQARLFRPFSMLRKPVSRRQITGVVRQALERTYGLS